MSRNINGSEPPPKHGYQRRIPRALTVGGSDSGGGAGIQADLKTFSAMNVYGMTVVTAVTAQNTIGVSAIQGVPTEIVQAQIAAVLEDIGVDAGKTGMLYNAEIVEVVAQEIQRYRFPVVVDPVLLAKDGSHLLDEDGIDALIEELIPVATIVTPNSGEAEVITGIKVGTLEDAKEAAERIVELGAEAALVKGGHLPEPVRAADVLCYKDELIVLESARLKTKNTHGTGCCLSAAVAAGLARGESIIRAVRAGKDFVTSSIRFGLSLGGGVGPVDPMASLHIQAERHRVILEILEACKVLEECSAVSSLVPESQMNLVMALPFATKIDEVAGIPGRIVRVDKGVRMSSCPRFGASRHVAGTVLVAMRYDPRFRAGINLRYSEKIVEICRQLGLEVSYYDRREEPDEVKRTEGMSTRWGAETAIRRAGKVPAVIYHLGDWGKEPMVTLLGRGAMAVAKTTVKIARSLSQREP